MKSSSIFIIIIGAVLGYLGYKYYYLPKTQTTASQSPNTNAISAPTVSAPTVSASTTSKALQSGKSTISQALSSGLISPSKLSTLTPSQLKITEIGLGSPIKTAIQKNAVSNALITTAGLTTNTVQGTAYGAKLSNASRLVRVLNTQIPSTSSKSSSVSQSFSKIPNSIPSSQTHIVTYSTSTVSHPISSIFKRPISSSIVSHPIITKSSIVEPKQSVSTSQVHISSPTTIALNRIQSVMKNRSMMRF